MAPDTVIAIAFGLLSTVISTVGALIAYLTLRAMGPENSSSSEDSYPTQLNIPI